MSFQFGDRVRINPYYLDRSIGGFAIRQEHTDCPATVISTQDHDPGLDEYGIAFDRPIGAHGCGNRCEPNSGLWVLERHLLYETEISSIEETDLLEVLTNE